MKTILLAIRAPVALAARRILNLLPIMAVALSFAAPTTAAEKGDPTGFYAGAGIALVAIDCPAGITCSSIRDTAPYLYLGGMFNEHFGAELGYLSDTEYEVSRLLVIPTPDFPTFTTLRGKLHYNALHLALIGRAPLNDHVAFFGKLGAVSANVSSSLGTAAATADGTGFMYGGGLELQAGNFAARLEYAVPDQDVDYGGLSILYRFR